jgi:hypothetical protein
MLGATLQERLNIDILICWSFEDEVIDDDEILIDDLDDDELDDLLKVFVMLYHQTMLIE